MKILSNAISALPTSKKPSRTALALGVALISGAAASSAFAQHHKADEHNMQDETSAAMHEAKQQTKSEMKRVERYSESATANAWRHGKLESALLLNRHLNNFAIDSDVVGDRATLSGMVESDVDKDLAEQVALSIQGIDSVDNRLTIDRENARSNQPQDDDLDDQGRSFSQRIDDATTTAAIKTQLLLNGNVEGLEINVDTRNNVVTLTGEVDSAEEKMLAEQLAKNSDDVERVDNQLKLDVDDDTDEG